MFSDPTTLSIAALAPRVGTCELCSVGPETLRMAVQVRHARGGAISFSACDRCGAAMRRVIAAAGGASTSGPASVTMVAAGPAAPAGTAPAATSGAASAGMASQGDLPPGALTPGDLAPDSVGAPVLVHEFLEPFVASDGQQYVVRAYGQERSDGTWIGWLTFVSADGQSIKRTARETTQSTQRHLAYWASGLHQSYLEGAFSRAT